MKGEVEAGKLSSKRERRLHNVDNADNYMLRWCLCKFARHKLAEPIVRQEHYALRQHIHSQPNELADPPAS